MPDLTLRHDDLCVGRRGDRIAIGRAGVGAMPLFLDEDTARWLALVALPAMGLSPAPAPSTRRPPAALAAVPDCAPALF